MDSSALHSKHSVVIITSIILITTPCRMGSETHEGTCQTDLEPLSLDYLLWVTVLSPVKCEPTVLS